MYTVLAKQNLSPRFKRLDIKAEDLVGRIKSGQFIVVMADPYSRRIPFSIYDIDWRRKCISVVFEEKDAETRKLAALKINDPISVVAGPYGQPFPSEKKGTLLFIGEGAGLVSLVSLCRTARVAGNKVIGIAGFETRKGSILENQMRLNCDKFYVMYGDGMHERRGDVLTPLKKVLEARSVDMIYAHASLPMLQEIYYLAWSANIPLKINVMDVLGARPAFFDNTFIYLKDEKYFPALGGVFVDGERMDIHEFSSQVAGFKEYAECCQTEAEQLTRQNGFARFKKFIWG